MLFPNQAPVGCKSWPLCHCFDWKQELYHGKPLGTANFCSCGKLELFAVITKGISEFFFSFFFFFLNQQKERRNHGNATSSGRRRRPHTHHPALLARSSTRASCTHHPYCLTCWQEKPFPRMGSAMALAPWSTAGGGRKGRQEEGDPVNKPRLNKLPGAQRAQSRARCPH